MSAADRLDEIQARADKATDGPWETRLFDGLPGKKVVGKREPSDLGRGPIVLMQPIFCTEQSADNAEFIAHARADVPRLVAALRAVLELHRPLRLYEHEDVCGRTDEEHCDERHVEFEEGCEYYCLDHPTDYVMCAECRDVNGDSVDYPCPTVRAVEAALGEVAS